MTLVEGEKRWLCVSRAVTDMVHSLGYVSVEALIESIADLPELSKAEQETLDDALDISGKSVSRH